MQRSGAFPAGPSQQVGLGWLRPCHLEADVVLQGSHSDQVDKRTRPPAETVGFSGSKQLGVGRISLTSEQDRILGPGGNGSELATSSDAEQGGVVPQAWEGRTLQQSKCRMAFQWRQTSAFKVFI